MKFIILLRIVFHLKYWHVRKRRRNFIVVNFYRKFLPIIIAMFIYVGMNVCDNEMRKRKKEKKSFPLHAFIFFVFLLLLYVNCLYQMTTKWYMYRCCIILSFCIVSYTHSMSVLSHKTYQILYFIFYSSLSFIVFFFVGWNFWLNYFVRLST